MCIAHYIAKVVVEKEKKDRKLRPNKLYTPIEHKQTNTKWVGHSGAQKTEMVGFMVNMYILGYQDMQPPTVLHNAM